MTDMPEVIYADRINKTETCWLWTGAIQRNGYGKISKLYAHRVFYELYNGKIPDGFVIDHMCSIKNCVNPLHLRVVTQKQNVMFSTGPTSINKNKTHCKNGHELSGKNLKIQIRHDGEHRKCRACDRDYKRKIRGKI